MLHSSSQTLQKLFTLDHYRKSSMLTIVFSVFFILKLMFIWFNCFLLKVCWRLQKMALSYQQKTEWKGKAINRRRGRMNVEKNASCELTLDFFLNSLRLPRPFLNCFKSLILDGFQPCGSGLQKVLRVGRYNVVNKTFILYCCLFFLFHCIKIRTTLLKIFLVLYFIAKRAL